MPKTTMNINHMQEIFSLLGPIILVRDGGIIHFLISGFGKRNENHSGFKIKVK